MFASSLPPSSCDIAQSLVSQKSSRLYSQSKGRRAFSCQISAAVPTAPLAKTTTRRALLTTAAAALISWQCTRDPLAQAAEQSASDVAPALKRFDGKAGFSFRYPDGWVTGFNRGDSSSGALALVGDFKTFETASVQKADISRLQLPPSVAEQGDVKALATALIDEARLAGNTYSFDLINEGTERRGESGDPYVSFEYVLTLCKGEIEEGLEGVRRCLGANGGPLEPITRHLVAAATFKKGQAYLITASSPIEKWAEAGEQLRAVAESFVA